MKIFVDTANVDEIRKAHEWGLADGVTTNPSLIMKSGRDFREVVKEILSIVNGPVSVEAVSEDADGMVREAEEFAKWSHNVVVKIPMTPEGLKAVRVLKKKNINTNVTLVFSANQALLAAKAGATYVSPFIGRLDDIKEDGMALVREILEVYRNYGFETEVIVASVRSTQHVLEAAKTGAHIATVPFPIIEQMFKHDLTDKGIKKFLEDWEKAKK
jgi:transaldolase